MARAYTSIESITKLMANDVDCVEKYARFLCIIDEDGSPRVLYARSHAPLNIIAVLGPAVYNGHTFDTALLLEIGLGRARPYHPAFAPEGVLARGRWIQKRRNYRLLGGDRFHVLWPFLLDIIIAHTEEVCSEWKCKQWNVPSPRARVIRKERRREVVVKTKETWYSRGARVSVSFRDEELVRMITGIDIARMKASIQGAAKLLGICLRVYANSDYSDAELSRFARARAGKMRLLIESFGPKEGSEYGRLRPHHVAYMYENGLIPPKNQALFERCAVFFHLVDMERVFFFRKLSIKEQKVIPGIDIWVIPIRKASADYLVCEIIPHTQGELV